MKLKEACKIAEYCGLKTIGEAVDNIDHHCTSLFKYENIFTELDELYTDPLWDRLRLEQTDKIERILK